MSCSLPRTAITIVAVLAMLLSGMVVFLAREAASPPPADAVAHSRVAGAHGTGYSIEGQWFGTWRVPEGTGFCVEFDKDHPDSIGGGLLRGAVPGMSTEESNRVKYVANHYGLTKSGTDAAAAAIYVWKMQNTSRFNSYYASLVKRNKISKSIQQRVTQIAAEAALHGPYKLSTSVGKGTVGQTVSGAVTLRAANGKPVPGRSITVSTTKNARVIRHDARTNAQGRMTFAIKVDDVGTVKVDARLVSPSAGGIWMNQPTAGHQRLVLHGKTTETATSSASFVQTATSPKVTVTCTPDCHGTATVTVTATNPCGAATLREHVYVNGTLAGGRFFDVTGSCRSASTKSTTLSKSYALADGDVVTTRYCYVVAGRCTSTPISNAGSVTVDCPPLPQYTLTAACPCGGDRSITYTMSIPASTRPHSYTIALTVTNAAGVRSTKSSTVASTSTRQLEILPTATLAKGSTATLTVTVEGRITTLDALTEAA